MAPVSPAPASPARPSPCAIPPVSRSARHRRRAGQLYAAADHAAGQWRHPDRHAERPAGNTSPATTVAAPDITARPPRPQPSRATAPVSPAPANPARPSPCAIPPASRSAPPPSMRRATTRCANHAAGQWRHLDRHAERSGGQHLPRHDGQCARHHRACRPGRHRERGRHAADRNGRAGCHCAGRRCGRPAGRHRDGRQRRQFQPALPTGVANGQTLSAIQTDAAGNASPATAAVTPDLVAPATPLATVSADGTSISGTGEPGATLIVRAPTTACSPPSPLPPMAASARRSPRRRPMAKP